MNIDIVHPLPVGKTIQGSRPSCPCRTAQMIPYKGVIKKVIENRSGVWYYMDIGATVKADSVTAVLD